MNVDKEYFNMYQVFAEDLDDPKRSEIDVKLTTINPKIDAQEELMEKEKKRSVSVDYHCLTTAGVYTNKELYQEINKLKEELKTKVDRAFLKQIKKSQKQMKAKEVRVRSIIKARKKLMELIPDWKSKK